jgi:hypothetical protein
MDNSVLKKLFLLIIIFGCILGCKKDSESSDPNPKPEDSAPLTAGKFKEYVITNKNTSIGVFVADDLGKERHIIYGAKNESGKLIRIDSINSFNDGAKAAFTIRISSDKLIREIEALSENGRRIARFTDYDLANKKVNVEIIDAMTNTSLSSKQSIALSDDIINTIRYIQSLKNGRKAASECSPLIEARNQQKLAECIIQEVKDFSIVCGGVVARFPNIASALVCTTVATVWTYVKCSEKQEDIEKYYEKCPEPPLPPLPPPPSPEELDCYLSMPKFNNLDERKQYIDNCKNSPNKSGSSTGDPHLTTTDNFYYEFQGYGEFIALKSTEDNFELQVRQEDIDNTGRVTVNTALAVQTGSDVVCVTANPTRVYVNNQIQQASVYPLALKNGASITKSTTGSQDEYTIKTVNGDVISVRIIINSWLDYWVALNTNRKGKVFGLLGNYDGNRDNDLRIRDGNSVDASFNSLYPAFADSWRISAEKDQKLLYYESGKTTASYTKFGFPQNPVVLTAEKLKLAEAACRNAGVTNEPFLSSCMYDLAVTNNTAFVQSSIWGQQNGLSSSNSYGDDVNVFTNVRIAISERPIENNDSCFVSYRTGKVYRVKEGAQNATDIDAVFSYYCGINMFKASRVLLGGGGLFGEMINQKWSVYRESPVESLAFLRDDDPTSSSRLDATLWGYIKTSTDVKNAFYNLPGLVTNTNQFGETTVINASQGCTPDGLMNKTLRRFRTQEGKLGIIRFTNWGKAANGWWLTMDIKIQK